MAGSSRRIQAGAAFIKVTADNEQFLKSIDQSERRVRKFRSTVTRIGAAFTAFGGAVSAAMVPLVSAAANAETAFRRFQLIFGDVADDMQKSLEGISRETGIGINTLIQQSSVFGAIFSEMRDSIGDERFVKIIEATQRSILDLAALSGTSVQEAADRMKSAFTSTGEAVDQFGINVRKANLEAEAQRLGFEKSFLLMTEQEKQLIKLSAIQRQFTRTGVAFVKLLNTTNAQFSLLASNAREMAIELGSAMNKVLMPLLRVVNQIAIAIRPVAKLISPALVPIAGLGIIAAALGSIFLIGRAITAIFSKTLFKKIGGVLGPMSRRFIVFVLTINWARVAGGLIVFARAVQTVFTRLIPVLAILTAVAALIKVIGNLVPSFAESMKQLVIQGKPPTIPRLIQALRGRGPKAPGDVGPTRGALKAIETRGAFSGRIGQQLAFATVAGAGDMAGNIAALIGLADSVTDGDSVRTKQKAQ